MNGFAPFKPIAAGIVTNAAAPATGPVTWNCTVADGGAGIYTWTLGVGVDANESIVNVEQRTVDLTVLVTHTSDIVKTITFADLMGADTDSLHAMAVFQIDPGLVV